MIGYCIRAKAVRGKTNCGFKITFGIIVKLLNSLKNVSFAGITSFIFLIYRGYQNNDYMGS